MDGDVTDDVPSWKRVAEPKVSLFGYKLEQQPFGRESIGFDSAPELW